MEKGKIILLVIVLLVITVAVSAKYLEQNQDVQTCDHSSSCQLPNSITTHSNLNWAGAAIIFAVALFVILKSKKQKAS